LKMAVALDRVPAPQVILLTRIDLTGVDPVR
jgi:hypothetical protein